MKIGNGPTKIRFRIPLEQEDVYSMIKLAYRGEVSKRGRIAEFDDDMASRLRKTAKWLTSDDLKFSLLLFGGYGNGKTTLVKSVQSMIENIKISAPTIALQFEREVVSSRMPTDEDRRLYSDLMDIGKLPSLRIITAQEIADYARRDADELSKIKKEPFLAIDDLGCEPAEIKSYGTAVTPVTDVFFVRYDAMLPTIITTNLDKPDIRNTYGDRVADRFNEMFELISFNNKSYRK